MKKKAESAVKKSARFGAIVVIVTRENVNNANMNSIIN